MEQRKLKLVIVREEKPKLKLNIIRNDNNTKEPENKGCVAGTTEEFVMNTEQIEYYQRALFRCQCMGWTLISKYYTDSSTKMKYQCSNGHMGEKIFYNLEKYGCPQCPKKSSKSAEERVIKAAQEKGYTLLTKYVDGKTAIELICSKGHKLSSKPSSILTRGCNICSNRSKDHAEQEFYQLAQREGYIILSPYINADTPVHLLCPIFHIWKVRPSGFKSSGNRCAKCFGNSPEQAQLDLISKLNNDGYSLIGPYINARTKVEILCPGGHKTFIWPSHYGNGMKCANCPEDRVIRAANRFYKKLEDIGYKALDNYVVNDYKINIMCPNEHIWNTRPNDIIWNDYRCPYCPRTESNGETNVRLYLESQGISFYQEFRIENHPDLEGKRFDFYFIYNEQRYLIEFDGRQHFEFVEYFHETYDNFILGQNSDKIKTQIPLSLGYKIIRIDYTQEKSVDRYIMEALESGQALSLSNEEMYSYLFE